VSVSKLSKVASIATKNNQQELAKKTKVLSHGAIETLVRDESVRPNTKVQSSLPQVNLLDHLSPDLQSELISRIDKGIDINLLLLELLKKYDREMQELKEQIGCEAEATQKEKAVIGKPTSRYVPVRIKKIIQAEFGSRCAKTGCNKAAANLHHEHQFSKSYTHDPRYLRPLCKDHHELEHAEEPLFQKFRAGAL